MRWRCGGLWILMATIALAGWCVPSSTLAAPAENVVLQLKWFHQFQFAGYYAAKAKGYFAQEGLEVEIRPLDPKKAVVEQVVSGQADYAIGDSGIVADYARGSPIVALAAIFQHDPLVFISRRESGIVSPYEMAGKRLMFDADGSDDGPLRAMLAESGLTPDKFTHIRHTYDKDDLTSGRVDVMSAYLTDQPFHFRQRGIAINIINPQSYGLDFYGDLLFTSEQQLTRHPGRAERFVRASLKGWQYALEHPEEMVQIIKREYQSPLSLEHLRFEAAETRKMILPDSIPLGSLDAGRLRHLVAAYSQHRLAPPLSDRQLQRFVYASRPATILSEAEQAWLKAHPVIRVGIDRDFAPYESLNSKGDLVGINADILRLISTRLGVRFEVVKGKTWQQTLDMARAGELDMLTDAVNTPERRSYLSFTEPFIRSPIMVINDGRRGYVGNLRDLYGKRVAVKQGYFMQEVLAREHPQIDLVSTTDEASAFSLIQQGRAEAYIGDAPSLNYLIQQAGDLNLRISGTTEYTSAHSMAVIHRHPELLGILEKTLASIPQAELDDILRRWMGVQIEHGLPIRTALWWGAAAGLLLLLAAFWVHRLRREVAARKKAEASLLERDARITFLLAGAPAVVHTQAVSGDFGAIFVSDNVSTLLGHQAGDFTAQSGFWASCIHPEDVERVLRGMPRLLAQGHLQLDYRMRRKDGTYRWVNDQLRLSRDAAGRPAEIIGAWIDVTDRKAAEAQLRKLSAVVEQTIEGIAITNVAGEIEYVNESFVRNTGYQRDELIGRNPRILQSKRTPKETYASLWRTLNQGRAWQGEFYNRRKDGSEYVESAIISPIRQANGEITHYAAIKEDVTDRRRIANELNQHRQNLELLVATRTHELEQARLAAESASVAKSAFLANMSHEIRTPMNAILGMVHILRREGVTRTQADRLEKIDTAAGHLLSIINNILDLSKIESGKLVLEQTHLVIEALLRNVRSVLSERAREKGVHLRVECDPMPTELTGDATRIQQALLNYAANAVKFTDRGSVTLRATLEEETPDRARIRFEVQDTGIGIDPETLPRLFDAFEQADSTTTRKYGGTGLGLSITKRLAKLMGGQVGVRSEPGQGSTFWFTANLARGASPSPLEPDGDGDAEALLRLRHAGRRVLVVDDEPINREIARLHLEAAGLVVDTAVDGQEAIALAKAHRYACILMDMQMPKVDGLQATQAIRGLDAYGAVPILAITANAFAEDRAKCLDAGMTDFIAKPFDPKRFFSILVQALDRHCGPLQPGVPPPG